MRVWPVLFLIFASQCARSDVPAALGPVRAEPVVVSATPVALFPDDPARQRLGQLRYLGGWSLTSNATAFGGLSSLRHIGDQFVGLTDAGGLVLFRLGRYGHVSDARIMPIPALCGNGGDKGGRDSEALTHDPGTRQWWIGLEGKNAICRTSPDLHIGMAIAHPRAMHDWPRSTGIETLLRLADGRFMAIAEASADATDIRPMLLFDRDPTNAAARLTTLGYRPATAGYSPTDAAQLPDGRLLILERRFSLTQLFTAQLVLVEVTALQPGRIVHGRIIARFISPATTENFEGVEVGEEDGRTVIWIVSDDNFASWQRTLLLKFAFDEAAD